MIINLSLICIENLRLIFNFLWYKLLIISHSVTPPLKFKFWKYFIVAASSTVVSVGTTLGICFAIYKNSKYLSTNIVNSDLEVGFDDGVCTIRVNEFGFNKWVTPDISTNSDNFFNFSNEWEGDGSSRTTNIKCSSEAIAGIYELYIKVNNISTTNDIEIKAFRSEALPISGAFFTFQEGTTSTINGYAPLFIQSWESKDMVKEYIKEHASNHANTLSFANCIISSTKNLLSITRGGYENINNFYGIIKCLDFTNTIFSLENSDSKLISGYETFGVDETDTIYNDFTELIQLNIERTNFCSTNLQSSTLSIYSANRTFAKSHFPKLKTLCLDATNIFTISNLTSSNFYSAIQTFSGCEFSMLEQLDLRDARFASSNLSTNNGNIATADGTFMNCSLSNIQILNLDNAIFCSPNMTKNGQISTAGWMFQKTNFSRLSYLNLDATWATANASTATGANDFRYGYQTFNLVNFGGLTTLIAPDVVPYSDMSQPATANVISLYFFADIIGNNSWINNPLNIGVPESNQSVWTTPANNWFGNSKWHFFVPEDNLTIISNMTRYSLFMYHPLIFNTFDIDYKAISCTWNVRGIVDASAITYTIIDNSVTFTQNKYFSSAQFNSPIVCDIYYGDQHKNIIIRTNDTFNEYINPNDVYGQQNGWQNTYDCNFTTMTTNQELANKMTIWDRWDTDRASKWTPNMISFDSNDGLNLWMDRNDDGTLESAGIDTSNHITQAFGCFEINARVNQKPVGYSTWYFDFNDGHADDGYMAANGSELDLFESTYYASKSKIKFHSWYDSWAKRQGRYIMFNSNGVDFYDNNFHKFTFFWTPNSYYYFIDNTLRINATFGNGDNTIPQIGICQVAENLKMDARIKCNQGNWGDGPSTYWDIQNHNNKCAYSIKSFKVYQNTNFIPYILNYWLA